MPLTPADMLISSALHSMPLIPRPLYVYGHNSGSTTNDAPAIFTSAGAIPVTVDNAAPDNNLVVLNGAVTAFPFDVPNGQSLLIGSNAWVAGTATLRVTGVNFFGETVFDEFTLTASQSKNCRLPLVQIKRIEVISWTAPPTAPTLDVGFGNGSTAAAVAGIRLPLFSKIYLPTGGVVSNKVTKLYRVDVLASLASIAFSLDPDRHAMVITNVGGGSTAVLKSGVYLPAYNASWFPDYL